MDSKDDIEKVNIAEHFSDMELSIKVLLLLMGIHVIGSTAFGVTSNSWRDQTYLLIAQAIPMTIALFGLWNYHHWAWLLALVCAGFDLLDFFIYVVPFWSARFAAYEQEPLMAVFSHVVSPLLEICIIAILFIKRDNF